MMKSHRIPFYLTALALLSLGLAASPLITPLAEAQQSPASEAFGGSYQVSGIRIVGNRRIDAAAIKAQIKGASGRVSQAQISDDIKTLYNTGFFSQVAVSAAPGQAGGVVLEYTVTEKPVARKLFIKGNKEVSESDLSEILRVDSNRFIDRTKLLLLTKKAVSYYQSRGYYDAELDYSTVQVGDNEVDLTFTVKEGERYRVREVVLRGIQNLDESDMRSVLQVQRYKWWSSWLLGTGRANQEMLEGDKQILRQYLLDHGYIEGSVGEASIEKRDDGLSVVFDITEGQQFRIGKITASGDLVDGKADDTLEGIKTEEGEVFNASEVRADIFTITDKFSDKGYAFANVVPNTDVNKDKGTVNLDFATTKGNLVKVNKINITGNEKTYDNVIRRELRIEEQETYSGTKIKRSQTLLQRLGYFDEVSIVNQPTDDPSKVDLDVNVKEAATGSFSAGAGYSTADGVLLNTRLSENNILGTGRRLNLNLDFGTRRNNQVLSLDDPRLGDTRLSGGIDVLRTDRQYRDFNRELMGGALTFGYPAETLLGQWAEDFNLNVRYEYSRININEVIEEASDFVKQSAGRSTSSSVTPSIVRNTINNPLNPTKGSRQTLSVEYAGPGGDQEFYLFEARNQWYYPFLQGEWGELVFSDRTAVGYGESLNDDPFPLFRRFFPGGINSVRGFQNRTLGPTDENGREYGGAKQFVNNAEVIFPLINSAGFRGVVFYDVGEAFDDNDAIDFGELRKAWGYGIRWASPLGPIRVEFGYPVDRRPGEDSPVTMFSFGAPM